MEFLRITAANGTARWVPKENVVRVLTGADTLSAATSYGSGRISRGLITEVAYTDDDGVGGARITVVAAVPAYTAGGILYEVGCLSPDGAFAAIMSNRTVNY